MQVRQVSFAAGDVVAVAGADWLAMFVCYVGDDGWCEVVFDGQPIPSRHLLERVHPPCGACLTRFQDGLPRQDGYCAACHTEAYWAKARAARPLHAVERPYVCWCGARDENEHDEYCDADMGAEDRLLWAGREGGFECEF